MYDTFLRTFRTNIDAELAKNVLESNGIPSVVQRKGATTSGTVGDAAIFVRIEDYQKASESLKDFQHSKQRFRK